jgi:hypothetical protein
VLGTPPSIREAHKVERKLPKVEVLIERAVSA